VTTGSVAADLNPMTTVSMISKSLYFIMKSIWVIDTPAIQLSSH